MYKKKIWIPETELRRILISRSSNRVNMMWEWFINKRTVWDLWILHPHIYIIHPNGQRLPEMRNLTASLHRQHQWGGMEWALVPLIKVIQAVPKITWQTVQYLQNPALKIGQSPSTNFTPEILEFLWQHSECKQRLSSSRHTDVNRSNPRRLFSTKVQD